MTKHMDRVAEALPQIGPMWLVTEEVLNEYHALREWSPEELAEFPEGSVMLHPEMGLLERDFRDGWIGSIEWGHISDSNLAERGPMRLVFNPDVVYG